MRPWRPLDTPPLYYKQVELQVDCGHVIVGWRGSDSWWTWSDKGNRASLHTSRWQNGGMVRVKPLAWRPYDAKRVVYDQTGFDPISLREVDVLLRRGCLTEGVLPKVEQAGVKSTWDSSWHIESTNVGDYTGREHDEPPPRWQPEPFDWSNYFVARGWFARFGKPGQVGWNRDQKIVTWRSYGLSYETVGERVGGISKQRCRDLYWRCAERAWDWAKSEPDSIRRLHPSLYQRAGQFD